jgi:preprotein translocase subunit SecY
VSELDAAERSLVQRELEQAAEEAEKPKGERNKDKIVSRLDEVKNRLAALGGAAAGALALATTITQLVAWAGTFL